MEEKTDDKVFERRNVLVEVIQFIWSETDGTTLSHSYKEIYSLKW